LRPGAGKSRQLCRRNIAKVRITVQADGSTIIREGHGSGEGRGMSPGEVHDIALKAAETDATKRALATFGKPFGLELYRKSKSAARERFKSPIIPPTRVGFHPDDTTPIPRPGRYHGFREDPKIETGRPTTKAPPLAPTVPQKIDKSTLALPEPKRLRDKPHLRFIASQPCIVCGRNPCDPHHLRFAQPRAVGVKVSDEFTVPLCRGHHRQLHQAGNEAVWWDKLKIDALRIARQLWEQTHSSKATSATSGQADMATTTE
jgi:hypothetical protein